VIVALGLVVAVLGGSTAGFIASRRARAWAIGRPVPAAALPLPPLMVTVVGAVVWTGIVWRWGAVIELLPLLIAGWVVVVATDIDLRAHVIPDRLTLRAPLVLVAALLVVAMRRGSADGLVGAAVASIVLPGMLLATSAAFRRLRGQVGIGLGDVKLALSLGLILGWLGASHLLLAVLVTFASSAAVVIVLLVAGRVDLSDRVPFGPHLAVGTVAAMVGGDPAAAWVADLVLR
jgi:leader peptidase (prepilin peptidase) / N-methyltransferase